MHDFDVNTLSGEQVEEAIKLITSLPASTTCLHDAEQSIAKHYSIEAVEAHCLVEMLLRQHRVEAHTALSSQFRGDQQQRNGVPYSLVRPLHGTY